MLFSVDAHAIGRRLTGNETYIRNLLNALGSLDDSSRFVTYTSGPQADRLLPERFAKRRVSTDPFVRLGWDLPRLVCEDRPALLHVQYTAPLACRVPVVATVHDVSFLEHPEFFLPARALQLRLTVARTVRRAAQILTPSEFSRQSIARAYGLDERKITVIPNAVSSAFRPLPREICAARVRSRFGIPQPFILTVGDLQPRKNHLGLIRAFEELLREYPALPHHLVLAGQETWYAPRIRGAARRSAAASRIHFSGFVSDEDLLQLYGACDVLAFPSFYEGFGLPILEAMACGRAVCCSDSSAIPEVADSAALLFDPRSIPEMVRALRDLVLDRGLRTRMERLGAARSSRFSWRTTARKTLEVYYEVGGRKIRPAAEMQPFSVPMR